MSLYKRNGLYWYDFTLRGKRIRGSTEQRDKYLAGLVLNDKMAQARARGIESILREPPVLKDFAVEFMQWVEESHSIAHETRRYYRNGWRLLKDTVLASKSMDEITNQMCQKVTFPGGNANANTALRTLRRMFSQAHELRKVFEVPKIGLREEWARNIAMTVADAVRIAGNMETGDARDAFVILRATGMRPKEVFSLRWEFFDWGSARYQNPKGKTKAARRSVPLLGESAIVLGNRYLAQGSPSQGWVFPAESGCGHMVTIQKAFTRARDAAGLPQAMCLYTARHGAATDLANVVSLKTTMQVLGHSDIATALKYQHPSTSDLDAKLRATKCDAIQ